MLRYNPFQPGKIVSTSMFAGREDELNQLEKCLVQTKHGNPRHALVYGERGIGKSSLLHYLSNLAKGNTPSPHNEKFSFLVVNVELESSNGYRDIIAKLGTQLKRSLDAEFPGRAGLAWIGSALSRLEAFGFKYDGDRKPENENSFESISDLFAATAEALGQSKSGICVIIDEADKPPVSAQVGAFSKIFTERLTRSQANNVLLVLAGATGVTDKLKRSHESSPRLFLPLELSTLTESEGSEIITKGVKDAEQKNGQPTVFDTRVISWIAVTGSQGYPHFIQEYASAAFDADSDWYVSMTDLNNGVYKEGTGALASLGKKYFEQMYLNEIGSDEYRKVLRVMCEHSDDFVAKATLKKHTELKESTLNNAINALKSKQIILSKPGTRGEYRLPSKSFAAWIKTFATPPLKDDGSQ